jgi:hypothetical protein
MDPLDLFGTQLGMGFISLDTLHVDVPDDLLVMGLGPLSRDLLQAMDGLEIHRTHVGSARITDAPALAFQQPHDRVFGKLTTNHQGALPFGELPGAGRTAQPFDVFVLACPRPMRDIPFAGTIELRTIWIWTRKLRISFLSWRRRYHDGPPLRGNEPKDTDLTSVVPRYYSPGLPHYPHATQSTRATDRSHECYAGPGDHGSTPQVGCQVARARYPAW